ncbi:GNAT family N-acetyltransferase [Herbaspirillum seropedicae]|uniref:GNAT family N-acetyltransferase n=1 Tax=Herbaspirillum seropedicae TaxID=964 RepID=UPI003FCC818A
MHTESTLTAGQAAQTTLRPMRPEDLVSCHAMSLHLHWPHRLADWQFHHQVSSSWAVELEQPDGARSVAGSGMLCPLGEDYASLGLVIIADALQGRGLGRAMMQRLLQDAGSRNVILNATDAGRPLYEKLGFAVTDTLSQHQSTTARAQPVLAADARIRPLRKEEAPAFLALDRQASGMDRSTLLQPLLATAEVAVLEQAGQVKGVAMLREFGRGRVIGPVIASQVEDAKALIAHWVHAYPGAYLRIDVPGRTGLKPWLEEIGLTCVDNVVSMCRGTPPSPATPWRTYSMINQALG